MRYNGGLFGGSWLSSFASDIGNGMYDGCYLVQNFDNLNPSNTFWTKYYNLYSKIDMETQRFLDFENWWGGYFLLNKKEMDSIVQNLLVGNKLSSNEVTSADGKVTVNLYNLPSPIVVFASWGDNITPPSQALNSIPDLYDSVDEIRAHNQTIVYCLHKEVGHLGIFVSAKVADREHTEIISMIEMIDALPPGLYEAIIEDTRPDMPYLELLDGRYVIKFEARTIEDILALDDGREDERPFEVVKRVVEINQSLYDAFLSPVVQAVSSEMTAHWWRMLQPERTQRYMLSDINPAMRPLKVSAQMVREQRQPVSSDNVFLKLETRMSDGIIAFLDACRQLQSILFLLKLPQGFFGYLLRRGPPFNEGLHHCTSRYAVDVGHHTAQADPCIIEDFVQSIFLSGKDAAQLSAVTGKKSKFTQVLGRNEALTQKTAPAKFSQPFGIADVGLASGDLLDMAGIDNASLDPEILQRRIYGFPENSSAFHDCEPNSLTMKPLGQFPELPMKSRILPGLRASFPDNRTNNLSSIYVKACATFNDSLQHVFHLPSSYGGKQPRHREGFSGTPCITLRDQQVLLPYVLSQGDGTLRGSCRKTRTMLFRGDMETTIMQSRSFSFAALAECTMTQKNFHHWG